MSVHQIIWHSPDSSKFCGPDSRAARCLPLNARLVSSQKLTFRTVDSLPLNPAPPPSASGKPSRAACIPIVSLQPLENSQ